MRIEASIDFWGEGVNSFCHEAVARSLHDAFAGVSIDMTDLALAKYERAAQVPQLERSAWLEYLRNGPRHAFKLPSGVTGYFSRYQIEFHLPDGTASEEVEKVRAYLHSLQQRPLEVAEHDQSHRGPA